MFRLSECLCMECGSHIWGREYCPFGITPQEYIIIMFCLGWAYYQFIYKRKKIDK